MSQPDSGDLRERATREIRRFEETARNAEHSDGAIAPGALCALRQPGRRGAGDPLGQPGGLGAALAGLDLPPGGALRASGFSTCCGQLQQNPAGFLPVLELMYFCLSLGYMGRYRLSPRGPAEIDKTPGGYLQR